MTTLRDQEKLTGPDVRPLVINVMNFNKGGEGQPTLLSFDDARTLFHEFGHALHGLLSDVTYPMVAGTSVLTDWVELPSQLYEHWLEQPDILRRFAIHDRTGRSIPDDLLKRLLDARNFNRGFATVEFVASALFDLDAHLLKDADGFDVGAFEDAALAKMGMPAEIVMRHRPTHFAHVFSGGGYASAYYSYMWSEVLDADAFAAFQETGDIFDPAMAKKLYDHVYSAGGRSDPEALYTRVPRPAADAPTRCSSSAASRRRRREWTSTPPDIAAASSARRIARPPKPAAPSSPRAATRSKRWSRWRPRSRWSIRT